IGFQKVHHIGGYPATVWPARKASNQVWRPQSRSFGQHQFSHSSPSTYLQRQPWWHREPVGRSAPVLAAATASFCPHDLEASRMPYAPIAFLMFPDLYYRFIGGTDERPFDSLIIVFATCGFAGSACSGCGLRCEEHCLLLLNLA